MISTLIKFALSFLAMCLFYAFPVIADSTATFTFGSTPGNIGPSDPFTAGSFSLVATGYSAPDVTSSMWDKTLGTYQMGNLGLGLAAGLQGEISGNFFIQLNLTQILAAHPASVALSVDSIEGADAYDVWGSNTLGTLGVLLASNQKETTFTLPDLGTYKYISISAADGNVLLDDVDVITPEPNSAILLLFGLVALVGAGTLGKKLIA